MRVKDENNRWIFIPININKNGGDTDKPIPSYPNSGKHVQPQLPISEEDGIEEARKELEKELEVIRKENKQ